MGPNDEPIFDGSQRRAEGRARGLRDVRAWRGTSSARHLPRRVAAARRTSSLPVAGVHVDGVRGASELERITSTSPNKERVLARAGGWGVAPRSGVSPVLDHAIAKLGAACLARAFLLADACPRERRRRRN